MSTIFYGNSIINSRQVVERIEELETLQDDFQEENELDDYPGFELAEDDSKWIEWDQENGEELESLRKLAEEANQYSEDWQYGSALIHRDHFVEYCKDLVSELGYLPADIPWFIESNIDWDGVANNMEQDYTSVYLDDEEYLIR